MKIGLLAYHCACNFGATLQLLSTYKYLLNKGHNPVVINWIPEDLEDYYNKPSNAAQYGLQLQLRKQLWKETQLCRNAEEVAKVIEQDIIEAVIVGSDAVAQHHPLLARLRFPSKRIFYFDHATSDRMFPNVFWGTFEQYLKKKVPIAILSASSQDARYRLISSKVKSEMRKCINSYDYVSVRDAWTQDMFSNITKGKVVPPVAPDPVFAFNYNALDLVPSKDHIITKFNIPENYILVTFDGRTGVTQSWIDELNSEAKKMGYVCVGLPFSNHQTVGQFEYMVSYPISPLEWYSLIKNSGGYIGNNMHPIVVSLHNAVPFFSFDNYGLRKLKDYIVSDESSKIKHILTVAGFQDNRVSCLKRNSPLPKPYEVINKLMQFDKLKAEAFAKRYFDAYIDNMNKILDSISYDKRN